jgi:S-DNA-T family DNA segregation ATPase FtsK/SpoIIIE
MAACAACGFDDDELARDAVANALTGLAHRFQALLSQAPDADALRRRPRREVWSALEYACHARDVLLVQRERVYLALVEDRPSFARMYRDERARLARYHRQDPAAVAVQIGVAAELAAQAFGNLDEDQWRRPLVYNFPEADERDVAWLAAHTVHEMQHHLADFAAALAGEVLRAQQ